MVKGTWEHRVESLSNQMWAGDMDGDDTSLIQGHSRGSSGLLPSLGSGLLASCLSPDSLP